MEEKILKNNFIKTQIWIISDKKDEAGDNGEYFYRYLNQIKPKEIQYYFAIQKNCSDYKRVNKYNNIIDLNSIEFLKLFLDATKIISSSCDSWVTNPFGEDGKYMNDLYKYKYIYLTNGIIKDDLSLFLNKITKNFDLIITSSKKEYVSFLKPNYGYNTNNIILTGLARYDNLKKFGEYIKKEKIVLVLPTWRMYIKGTENIITHESIKSESFRISNYFIFYNKLINNHKLLNFMENHKYLGIFCLHSKFKEQWTYFKGNKLFKIKEKCNYQEILMKSSLLITDYSNTFFDFVYLGKPIIYTQFDYYDYRNKHYPEGYFDYKTDGFGPICHNIQCTINEVISIIENKCQIKKIYYKRAKKFFKFFDNQNCHRIFIGISKDINNIYINSYKFYQIIYVMLCIILLIMKSNYINRVMYKIYYY